MKLNFTVKEIKMIILHMKRHRASMMFRGKYIRMPT